jgi:predicted NAD/FAD-binding protein
MKVAVIGAGISGLTSAYYLSEHHDVTVFESAARIGGHTATINVEHNGKEYAVDTGFIVYNDWTYPNFIKLLNALRVDTRPTQMSFSVSCENSGLEYAGSNLNTLFADRSNLVKPAYWQMLRDIVRFNRQAIEDLSNNQLPAQQTLEEYLQKHRFGAMFRDKYLVPMGAAIWSAGTDEMLRFPVLFFVRFFKNHGLLSIKNRPQWHTIAGGSAAYLQPLTERFNNSIHLGTEITNIQRSDSEVAIEYQSNQTSATREVFDALVVATHSDQALTLLKTPTATEREILGAIPYQDNDVVLHTDESLLPARELAWSSWNYRLIKSSGTDPIPRLTYNMNILQGIDAPCTFCVSLNQNDRIDQSKILGRYNYSHPVFSLAGMQSQQRWDEIAGSLRTWYCGAYWGSGFHEDGVVSALRVVESVNQSLSPVSAGAADAVSA